MTVCYDLRFPELYRILAVRGARVITVPSAFTLHTGQRPLGACCCARGRSRTRSSSSPRIRSARRRRTTDSYGRSLIVDPWGVVLATAPDEECFVAADLDLARQERIRATLPSLANRRPEAYRWPEEAPV